MLAGFVFAKQTAMGYDYFGAMKLMTWMHAIHEDTDDNPCDDGTLVALFQTIPMHRH